MTDLFYVFGIALTLGALILSFLGLRSERFPQSRGLYGGALAVMAALVAASCGFAIALAREEQEHRAEEIAHFEEEQAEAEEGAAEEGAEPEEEGTAPPTEPAPDGADVFAAAGCGSCHTLAEAGTTGTAGPDLDEALADRDKDFIETSIVDPGAEVAEGFQDGIMPTTYAEDLSEEALSALVDYLARVAGQS